MSSVFWATFFGAALGLFSVNVIQVVIEEYRSKRRRKEINLLLEEMEDFEADDDD